MRKLVSIVWSASEKFLADDGWAIASYIGLTLLTSLFPFLIFVAALAGFFGSAELAEEAARLVFAEWPKEVAGPIAEQVSYVLTAPRGGLLTLGAVLASYFASSAIEALRVGLNRAYGLVEKRPWWLLQLQSLGLVLVGSLALAFLVVLGPLILDALGAYLPWVAAARDLLTFARLSVAAFMLATSLLLAHLTLPAHRPRLVDLLHDVRPLPAAVHELERRLGEEGEAHVLIEKAVVGATAEEVVARMRVDEEALATVHMAEIHSAMDMVIEPRHPQVLVGDVQSPDLIVAHAIVFRQDDLDRVAA